MKRTKAAAAMAAALCLFVSGCSSGGSVSGSVKLDGNLLKTGVVTFHPVAGGAAAIGPVDSSGNYELFIGKDQAIPPGDYLVTVDAAEATSSEAPVEKGPPRPPPPPKRITPNKYANKETTDLKVTVKAGSNKIPLELKSN